MNLITNVLLSSSLILIPILNSAPVEVYIAPEEPVKEVKLSPKMPQVRRLPTNTTLTPSQAKTREKIVSIFGEDFAKAIKNESNYNQFKSDGTTLISRTSDCGVMQINQVHWARAKSLGLDIFNSEDDNIIMGKIIYDEQGPTAWTAYRNMYPERSG